jgi:hypothetical protein
MIAEALCRRWHLPLRNPARNLPRTMIAEALCRAGESFTGASQALA